MASPDHNGSQTPSQPSSALRYANFDTESFSVYSSSSPSHAKRALQAHLKDTDRRIQDASKLGTTLLQQRKELSARLKDVEEVEDENEVPENLRKKLHELEKEYNEVGKETARAFLPKARPSEHSEKSVLSASGRESPTKLSAPSRKQRNVPTNRVHDIEFATEISTSLLAQVRQLQAALMEKDDALKGSNSAKAELESELYTLAQRVKRLDESEQRFKDENWNLETRLQELEAGLRESADQETRLNASLKSTQAEKTAAQRDLDNLKAAHEKLMEDHNSTKKLHENDLHGLRRDIGLHQTENQSLHKKIQELTTQNTELAKAVSYRYNQPSATSDLDFVTADEDANDDHLAPDHYDPTSPVKGTPRHGMLESETLKSSLNHAHRMIQNLKSNIHREKTEKIELKRMLQDARDELESRRGDGSSIGANMARKRRAEAEALRFKKPNRPDRLGSVRSSTTEYLEDDPDWEDNDGERTPSKSAFTAARVAAGDDVESTDAFETANERNTTTETESFETGTEGLAGADSDELTETEGSVHRARTFQRDRTSLAHARPGERYSYLSTASTSDDEAQDLIQTPPANEGPKYRVRMSRGNGNRRSQRISDMVSDSPSAFSNHSPASSIGTPRPAGQTLGDELDALDDESIEGTPSRLSEATDATPVTMRQASIDPETPSRTPLERSTPSMIHDNDTTLLATQVLAKPIMVDTGVMTDPWEPESKPSLAERAGDLVGGALAGFGLERLGQQVAAATHKDESQTGDAGDDASPAFVDAATAPPVESVVFHHSNIISQATEPIEPESTQVVQKPVVFSHALILVQETEPVEPSREPDAFGVSSPVPLSELSPSMSSEYDLSFSSIEAQDFTPSPGPPLRSEKRNAVLYAGNIPVPRNFSGALGPEQFAANEGTASRVSSGEASANPAPIHRPMTDEGSQTTVMGGEIDELIRNKGQHDGQNSVNAATVAGAAGATGIGIWAAEKAANPIVEVSQTNDAPAPTTEMLGPNDALSPNLRRPGSAGSTRSRSFGETPPPLPENSSLKIAAAQQPAAVAAAATAATSSMGPPIMPASAYKSKRPRTPLERPNERSSRDGTTPRKGREGRNLLSSPSHFSRRSSVSSFASELDDRFNMHRAGLMYPADIEPSTDPRMIQAITQTMIGEYLWKYTRKAGRSETSNTRHRRFFWVHPYTRTLYWSEHDPSTAGRNMMKAKSVAIEAVRVISDDNAYPPGLHRKSLVVVTPGREIVFTAPTGQRHETWFNALSYLLLRTESEKAEMDDAVEQPHHGFSIRRSLSRAAGRDVSQSRQSLSSYNSRTTRTSSPHRTAGSRHGTVRPSVMAKSSSAAASPQLGAPSSQGSDGPGENHGSRFSSLAGRFRSSSGVSTTRRGRSSISKARQVGGATDPADIYDASVVHDSAEDLRAVIARQEAEADRLENVRACCDGKHDVGSLTHRSGRHVSLGNRLASNSHQHSTTTTPHESMRSRV